jgi:hypothetical protein
VRLGVRVPLAVADLLVVPVVRFIAGAIAPPMFLSDGLGDLQGETRLVGEAALDAARTGCSEPVDNLLTRQLRVVQVEPVPGRCAAPVSRVTAGYRVLIRRYTFFGIPLGWMSVCGDMGECRARAGGLGRPP